MTDEQIIKAFDACIHGVDYCGECPYSSEKDNYCFITVRMDALALIKRQRKEIALLNKDKDRLAEIVGTDIAKVRAEAIREFAERVSTHIGLLEAKAEEDCAEMCRFLQNATIELHAKRSAYRDVRKCMSEIVKEMTEEQK